MACVLVVVPDLAVVAVGDPEAGHPVFPPCVGSTFSYESCDQGRGTHVKL